MAKAMPVATFSEGRVMTAEEIRAVDIFADIDERTLEKFPGTVRRRTFKPGDVICREGEGGTTAFYIIQGTVEVFIGRRVGASATRRRGGLMARVGALLGQRRIGKREHDPNRLVPIDAGSADLRYGELATRLSEGEVFGEMSCLNLAPRSATIVAETDCVMVEVLRNMYEALQRSKTFKERTDAKYRERALDNHLRNVPMLSNLPDDAIAELREAAELVSHEAGATIFAEGDESDALYIIRLGQVRVSKAFPGGDRRLAYLTRGDFFGETGLLRNAPRNASCVAVDHPVIESGRKRRPARVELVRIRKEDFERVVRRFPDLVARLERVSERRVLEQQRAALTILPTVQPPEVEDLGLLQGQNLMLIDLEKCTRCDQCAQACASAHEDNISRLIREGPRYDKYLVPASCRMCMDPVCMIGCPVGSIRRTEDLNIFIEDWCVGCGVCAKQCPYNSIQLHPLEALGEEESDRAKRYAETGEVISVTERAIVCDQCSALPTGPACVYACPHDAAKRVNAREFLQASGLFPTIEGAQV